MINLDIMVIMQKSLMIIIEKEKVIIKNIFQKNNAIFGQQE